MAGKYLANSDCADIDIYYLFFCIKWLIREWWLLQLTMYHIYQHVDSVTAY